MLARLLTFLMALALVGAMLGTAHYVPVPVRPGEMVVSMPGLKSSHAQLAVPSWRDTERRATPISDQVGNRPLPISWVPPPTISPEPARPLEPIASWVARGALAYWLTGSLGGASTPLSFEWLAALLTGLALLLGHLAWRRDETSGAAAPHQRRRATRPSPHFQGDTHA